MRQAMMVLTWFVVSLGDGALYGPFNDLRGARTVPGVVAAVRPATGVDAQLLRAAATYPTGCTARGCGCPASGPGANHCESR